MERPAIETKAKWLKGRTKEIGTYRGGNGVIVTFEMPIVNLEILDGKWKAVKCSCPHHVIKYGGKATKAECQYSIAAENDYKLPD